MTIFYLFHDFICKITDADNEKLNLSYLTNFA